ncbi:MFS transporter [Saccharothrix saharensis]|uniref:MFS transporter n=1 Tax=Saccharothrix saharensis TaxID=571190 RepID=UPI0036CAF03C
MPLLIHRTDAAGDAMAALSARYRTALGYPGMAPVMSAAFIAYLLSGMMSLSLLLATERTTDSYAVAGLVAGAYAAGLAIAAPVWGRLVDRRGPRLPLAVAVSLQVALVAAFIVASLTVKTPALLGVAACLAGACTPPTSTVARRIMAGVPDEGVQRTLFALSGFFTELVFVVGPLVVAGIVLFLHPLWAVGLASVASGTGALLLRSSAAAHRLDRDAARVTAAGTHRPARWNAAQVRVLVVITLGAFTIGGVQVSVVAHAQGLGTSEGVFVAALAVGGVVASFLYGGLSLPGSLRLQLIVSLALYGALILTLTTAPGFLLTAVLLLFIGAATGPADGIEAMLVGRHTPSAAQAQAFAVLVTANWLGFAIGSAATGTLIEEVSPAAGVITAGLSALVAAALMLPPLPRTAPDTPQSDQD